MTRSILANFQSMPSALELMLMLSKPGMPTWKICMNGTREERGSPCRRCSCPLTGRTKEMQPTQCCLYFTGKKSEKFWLPSYVCDEFINGPLTSIPIKSLSRRRSCLSWISKRRRTPNFSSDSGRLQISAHHTRATKPMASWTTKRHAAHLISQA